MSKRNKYGAAYLQFDNLYHLVDCLMLFGAQIKPHGDGYRLHIRRRRRKWPALGFVAIMVEAQDPLMDFLKLRMNSEGDDLIEFRTRSSRFLGHAHKRWYGSGELKMPDDIRIDETALLLWLLRNWGDKEMSLPMMGGCVPIITCMELSGQVDNTNFVINEDHRKQVTKWLADRVPEEIWKTQPVE